MAATGSSGGAHGELAELDRLSLHRETGRAHDISPDIGRLSIPIIFITGAIFEKILNWQCQCLCANAEPVICRVWIANFL